MQLSCGVPAGRRGELRSDAEALRSALSDLIRVYQFRDRDRICCHGLSVSQCYALEAVVEKGSLTLNELSAELFLDKSTASRVVKGLEEKGLVSRGPHPEDGRAVVLEASARGRRTYAQIQEDILCQEECILAEFDEGVRRELPKLIAALARAAAGGVDTSGGCCRVR